MKAMGRMLIQTMDWNPPLNADPNFDPDDDDIPMGLFGPDTDDDEAADADPPDVTPAGPEKADDDDANVKAPEAKRQRKNTMALNSLSTLNTILENMNASNRE